MYICLHRSFSRYSSLEYYPTWLCVLRGQNERASLHCSTWPTLVEHVGKHIKRIVVVTILAAFYDTSTFAAPNESPHTRSSLKTSNLIQLKIQSARKKFAFFQFLFHHYFPSPLTRAPFGLDKGKRLQNSKPLSRNIIPGKFWTERPASIILYTFCFLRYFSLLSPLR